MRIWSPRCASAPSIIVRLAKAVLSWIGEPFKSSFRPEAMRALLAKYGFDVTRDEDLSEIDARLSARA